MGIKLRKGNLMHNHHLNHCHHHSCTCDACCDSTHPLHSLYSYQSIVTGYCCDDSGHCDNPTIKKTLHSIPIIEKKTIGNNQNPFQCFDKDPAKPLPIPPLPPSVDINHCPANKVISISQIGGKVVITMNDCTYYESELKNVDLATFHIAKTIVTDVKVNIDTNSLTIHYHDTQTGNQSSIDIPLPPEIYVKEGKLNSKGDELILVHNTGTVVKISLKVLVDKIMADTKTYIENIIKNISDSNNVTINNKIENLTNKITEITEQIFGNKIKETSLNIANKVFTITLNDGTIFNTDFTGLLGVDKFVHEGTVINNKTLKLFFNDGSSIDINLQPIIDAKDVILITGGNITNNQLILHLSNGNDITVDISDLINDAVTTITNNISNTVIDNATNHVINNILNLGYNINNQNVDYSLVDADFDGRTIIRCSKDGNQTITITRPSNEAISIGKAVVIRKVAGTVGTVLNLVAGVDTVFTPTDITPLRRIGSAVTLIYTGSGNWDVFGELP